MTKWMLMALAALPVTPALAVPRLDGVLTDHAVIQRDKPIRISGSAEPGEAVRISLAGQSVAVKADRAGRFSATLAPLPAGGPYEMQVSARSGLAIVRDLLLGDVFLCSGQSNMEMSVERSQDSYSVYAAADDQLRLLTVPKATAFTPQTGFAAQPGWAATTPATASPFSAACFYMAQALRKSAKVPIGAIHSSWGGSRISAWMDEAGLRAADMGDGVEALRLYARDVPAAVARTSAKWEQWWRDQSGNRPGAEPWQPQATLDWQPAPRIGAFNRWGIPALADYVGMLWFRKDVTLTAKQARQEAVLSIGAVDDADVTWVNGKAVGGSSNAATPRNYLLPAGTLVAGSNVITINDDNVWAEGGMIGPVEAMRLSFADGTSVALDTGWRYAVAGKPRTNAPRAPWDDINGAGTLYNAMIAPLGPIALAGVAWYQGESDTDLAGYDKRLAAMMRDWRRQFGLPELPFAIVQLSAYGDTASRPRESGWARLHDTQRRVAEKDGHAAVAVTLDLGDPLDIHPGEKREVGRRLARAMRSLAYGETVAASGPRVVQAGRGADGTVTLSFADVTGELTTRGADRAIGFELCGAEAASCRYADAWVNGNQVVLAADGRPVTHVRYAWADSPTVNLFDRDGLPVGSFEISVP
ncbi:sialate O-acetylesterase [Sphingomonas kyeonggiensis]|uniref:Sialate O-acetylesterase n=1 Tax=Sphingomonas kyeonggiensis TaxID=1268553 RepID=A0A7W6JPZ2_9SPHN|nr:sialate O-acetylesterase [Sphingomonas kyeonggiensis]MBB4097424.1 sialate O-acetylesterase [Sphingomonas kyeonggiensis]